MHLSVKYELTKASIPSWHLLLEKGKCLCILSHIVTHCTAMVMSLGQHNWSLVVWSWLDKWLFFLFCAKEWGQASWYGEERNLQYQKECGWKASHLHEIWRLPWWRNPYEWHPFHWEIEVYHHSTHDASPPYYPPCHQKCADKIANRTRIQHFVWW